MVTAAIAVPSTTSQKPPHAHFSPMSGRFSDSSVSA
jgi:hypothetical protein